MSENRRTIRVGVHPSNPSLFALRRRDFLEEILERTDATVDWVDYRSGLETLDFIREDRIDVGGTGATPPITLQSEGIGIAYIAASEPRPAHGKLVVSADSEIGSVGDLRGRKVALAQGSYQTILLAVALDQAGLTFADVERVDTAEADSRSDSTRGRTLLETGQVDAWIGGDPDLLAAEQAGTVRELIPTEQVMSNRSVWFGTREFVEQNPDLIDAFVTALQRIDAWIEENLREAGRFFADHAPGDLGAAEWERALSRRPWGPRHIGEDFVAEQQKAADLLARQGIIWRPVKISEAVVAPSRALAGVS